MSSREHVSCDLAYVTELHVPTEVHVASVTCGALTCEMIQVTCQ